MGREPLLQLSLQALYILIPIFPPLEFLSPQLFSQLGGDAVMFVVWSSISDICQFSGGGYAICPSFLSLWCLPLGNLLLIVRVQAGVIVVPEFDRRFFDALYYHARASRKIFKLKQIHEQKTR